MSLELEVFAPPTPLALEFFGDARPTIATQSTPLVVARAGPPGPAGAPGNGPSGYTHQQSVASSTWVITHNLGYRPAVDVIDSSGSVLLAEITHQSANALTVTFAGETSGIARLA